MRFWLVMLLLGWRMRWLAWRNPDFRRKLEGRDMVMQWCTMKGAPARWYHFLHGKVISRPGMHQNPSVSVRFESAPYAFETLRQAGRNKMVFMEGMGKGRIRIDGDPGELMWFMSLMKYIAPRKKKAK